MRLVERDASGTVTKVTNAAKLISALIAIIVSIFGAWFFIDGRYVHKAEAVEKYCSIEKANETEMVLAGSLKSFQIGQYQQRLRAIDMDKRYWKRVLKKNPSDQDARDNIRDLDEEKRDVKRYLDKLLGR